MFGATYGYYGFYGESPYLFMLGYEPASSYLLPIAFPWNIKLWDSCRLIDSLTKATARSD